jgi:uridylate kinase
MQKATVLLKLSGELINDADNNLIYTLCKQVQDVLKHGINLAIVVGGGNLSRGRDAFNKPNEDKINADRVGMLSTVINALNLKSILRKNISQDNNIKVLSSIKIQGICNTYDIDFAQSFLSQEANRILILAAGIGTTFVSTDTASIIRALEIGCQIVLKATKVDGIYSEDPKINKCANLLNVVSFEEVLLKKLNVMDMASIALARDNGLKIKIFNFMSTSIIDVINDNGTFSLIS